MLYVALAIRFLIGIVFAASAFGKLRSRAAFRDFTTWLAGLPVAPHRLRRPTAWAIAGAEVSIVALVAAPWTVRAGLALAGAVLAAFAVGTLAVVRAGMRVPCQCFGTSAAPLGARHAARNLLLCAVACLGALYQAPWAPRPAGIAVSVVGALAAAMFVVFLDDLAALIAGANGRGLPPLSATNQR